MRLGELRAALLQRPPAVGSQLALDLLDERRQAGFRVGRNRQIHVGHVLEILQVALDVEIERGNADRFGVRRAGTRPAAGAAAAGDFQIQDHVGLARAVARERMARGEVHAVAAAVDRRLQQFGELDEQRDAVRRARRASRVDARILGGDEQACRFAHRRLIRRRSRRHREPRDAHIRLRHRLQLHVVIDDQQHRLGRRRHRNLVGAHRGLGERGQRRGLIVPLHETIGSMSAVSGLWNGIIGLPHHPQLTLHDR